VSKGIEPVVGQWYRRIDRNQRFRIVQLGHGENVEVEQADGRREQIRAEAWAALDLEESDAPPDWPGRPEDLEPDDLDHPDSKSTH
jgi:hypothetical protein